MKGGGEKDGMSARSTKEGTGVSKGLRSTLIGRRRPMRERNYIIKSEGI